LTLAPGAPGQAALAVHQLDQVVGGRLAALVGAALRRLAALHPAVLGRALAAVQRLDALVAARLLEGGEVGQRRAAAAHRQRPLLLLAQRRLLQRVQHRRARVAVGLVRRQGFARLGQGVVVGGAEVAGQVLVHVAALDGVFDAAQELAGHMVSKAALSIPPAIVQLQPDVQPCIHTGSTPAAAATPHWLCSQCH
jgi:hypothetical protein